MNSQQSAIVISDEIRDTLRQVSTATIATQLFKRGLRQQFLVGLQPLTTEHSRFVGEAVTMRFIPMREDIDSLDSLDDPSNLQWRVIEEIGPNEVVVVDSRSDPSAASSGGILLTRAMKKGAAGFVTDGALRDAHTSIARLDFPVFMRTAAATTRLSRFHVADLQVPIGCAGVAVYPGDVLVADEDGVIVIPRHMAEEVGVDALVQEKLEAYLEARIASGESLTGVYPPNQQTLKEYEAWNNR
ncbi:MAG: ribonuclease activity regulator RraA [Acetobacteraceae bacterium]